MWENTHWQFSRRLEWGGEVGVHFRWRDQGKMAFELTYGKRRKKGKCQLHLKSAFVQISR